MPLHPRRVGRYLPGLRPAPSREARPAVIAAPVAELPATAQGRLRGEPVTAFSAAETAGHIANRALADRPLRLRTLPCACGGEITADVTDPTPEVQRHNQTLLHRLWWSRLEREAWDEE